MRPPIFDNGSTYKRSKNYILIALKCVLAGLSSYGKLRGNAIIFLLPCRGTRSSFNCAGYFDIGIQETFLFHI